jgi:hypothetical protein
MTDDKQYIITHDDWIQIRNRLKNKGHHIDAAFIERIVCAHPTTKPISRPVNTGTDALDEVYEKFKHLDQCLSDTEWCNSGTQAIYGIAGEMWRAIKQGKDR